MPSAEAHPAAASAAAAPPVRSTAPAPAGEVAETVRRLVRDVADFPTPGVLYKDITPLLADGAALRAVVADLAEHRRGQVDVVAGLEARGFIFGAAVALALGVGFVPIRKAGRLPAATTSISYDLEYGSAQIEVHEDAVAPGARVLVVDDVLATGGTAEAACALLARCGAQVAAVDVVVELAGLEGRARLAGQDVRALLTV